MSPRWVAIWWQLSEVALVAAYQMVGRGVMAAVPELDVARIHQCCARRAPAQYRNEVRAEATLRGKAVTIFDCRPPWHATLAEVVARPGRPAPL